MMTLCEIQDRTELAVLQQQRISVDLANGERFIGKAIELGVDRGSQSMSREYLVIAHNNNLLQVYLEDIQEMVVI